MNLSFGRVTDKSLFLKKICLFEYLPKLEYLTIRDNLIQLDVFLDQLPETIKEISCRDNYFSGYEEKYPGLTFV
ncbi:hypothetical protein [Carnobacterium maltaromaticum]|uniref:hypothetical protein n=1 Tax=Carnobacterium maltaromaticum TaxID=2751 RepID=UPI002ADD47B9|nr:hypothetical protein [Carnobacterium maltaromaticum]